MCSSPERPCYDVSRANALLRETGGNAAYFDAGSSAEATVFAARYEQRYKARADFFCASSHDALTILARAVNEAKITEPEAMRRAILAIRGFKGVEGEYNFDANGDGLHGYNVVHDDDGKITFIRHIEFQD